MLIPYFICPRFVCQTLKNPKISFSLHGVTRTYIMVWRNPKISFPQSAFFSQNDQNVLGQPWVDRRPNNVKIITKQHFSWFYIKPELLGYFYQLWPSLTWSWLPMGLGNPNLDPVVKTGWDQCHCEENQILIPTTIHGSKSELERPRYHENWLTHRSMHH